MTDAAAVNAVLGNVRSVYVHLDLDVLDPSEGRANEYAAPGGASVQQLLELIGAVGAATRIVGMSVSAYDPSHDPDGRVAAAAVRLIMATIQAAAGGAGE